MGSMREMAVGRVRRPEGGPGACGWGGRAIRTLGGASALVVQSQRLQTTEITRTLIPRLPVHVTIVASPRLTPHSEQDLEPKQEEEMGDLFGEDSNVDFVHHSRLVLQ